MTPTDDIEAELERGWRERIKSYGAKAKPTERLAAERRANRTPAQRARKALKTTSINFRTTPQVKALAKALASELDSNIAGAVEAAIKHFAKSKGVKP